MNKLKKIISSILIILAFFCFLTPKSNANFFTDDWFDEEEEDTLIEDTIDNENGGIFEKIIAKMIGGLAQSVFNITTNKEFGVGFKNYDELIFAQDSTAISPFTEEQWGSMMQWYKIMSAIAGTLILIVVVIIAYKFIVGGYSIEKRNEAKDSLMRLFFGAVLIACAPLFVKFLLFLNNNLVRALVGYSSGSLDELLGNNVISNIRTGNAIATAIVIALFAYLFFKINVKFIIRQFTILIFTLFTPIISIMWMINKRTIGASIWFGQIFINIFMQFIYSFLFLIYMQFLPQSGGWATSILWAMMILPLAEALQNTLQNLVSRIAGINNDDIANRGIGMTRAMAYSVRAIVYQFRSLGVQNLGKMFSNETIKNNSQGVEMVTTKMDSVPIKEKPMKSENAILTEEQSINNPKNNKSIIGNAVYNTGKEFLNMGMYIAEGKNFNSNNQKKKYDDSKGRIKDK